MLVSATFSQSVQRSTTSFLSVVRFSSVNPTFHGRACGILSSILLLVDLFFNLSTSISMRGNSNFQINHSICFPLKFYPWSFDLFFLFIWDCLKNWIFLKKNYPPLIFYLLY
jgi:hypothetical protein